MKKITISIICMLFFVALNVKSQERIAMVDLNKYYEAGTTEATYYQIFSLPLSFNQKQIDELKTNSLTYKHVKDIIVSKSTDYYEVKLLLSKETENISGYFRDYLLNLSINKMIVDGEKINTVDYYSYLSKKLNHQETSK
jgi:hypothetical protein